MGNAETAEKGDWEGQHDASHGALVKGTEDGAENNRRFDVAENDQKAKLKQEKSSRSDDAHLLEDKTSSLQLSSSSCGDVGGTEGAAVAGEQKPKDEIRKNSGVPSSETLKPGEGAAAVNASQTNNEDHFKREAVLKNDACGVQHAAAIENPEGNTEETEFSKKNQSMTKSVQSRSVIGRGRSTSSFIGNSPHQAAYRGIGRGRGRGRGRGDENLVAEGPKNLETRLTDLSEEGKTNQTNKTNRSSASDDAPGVTVHFNVLLHPEWAYNEENDKVAIRFGAGELGAWSWNAVDMIVAEPMLLMDNTRYLRLAGTFILPREITATAVAYKYVVIKGEKVRYEFVTPSSLGGVVNRALVLPDALKNAVEGTFHRYDDVIRKEPGRIEKGWNFLSRSTARYVQMREVAIEAFIPQWPGFHTGSSLEVETCSEIASSALKRLRVVVDSISRIPLLEDKEGASVKKWEPVGFDAAKVLASCMKAKLKEVSRYSGDKEATNKLVAASAIAVVCQQYDFRHKNLFSFTEYVSLSFPLTLRADLKNRACPALDAVFGHFGNDEDVASAVFEVLFALLNSQISSWIRVLPLYHFVVGVSKPFQRSLDHDPDSQQWWGLGGLLDAAMTFRSKSKAGAFLSSTSFLVDLFRLDALLIRAVLFSVKASELADWVDYGHPGEILTAVSKRFTAFKRPSRFSSDPLIDFLQKSVPLLAGRVSEKQSWLSAEEHRTVSNNGISATIKLLVIACREYCEERFKREIRGLVDLAFSHLCVVVDLEQNSSGMLKSTTDGAKVLETIVVVVANWLRSLSPARPTKSKDLNRAIECWELIINQGSLKKVLANAWVTLLGNRLSADLRLVDEFVLLEAYCLSKTDELHPSIRFCLNRAAEEAVLNLSKNARRHEAVVQLLLNGSKFDLMNVFLREMCPRMDASDDVWLEVIRKFSFWETLLRRSDKLSVAPRVSDVYLKVSSLLKFFARGLQRATITYHQFSVIKSVNEKMATLCGIVSPGLREIVRSSVMQQATVLAEFEKEREIIQNFLGFCDQLGGIAGCQNLSDRLSMDVRNVPLKNLTRKDKHEQFVFFSVPHRIYCHLKLLYALKQSFVFPQIWKEIGEREVRSREDGAALSLAEIERCVMQPVFVEWNEMSSTLISGLITLEAVKNRFGIYLRNEAALRQELEIINSNTLHQNSDSGHWVTCQLARIAAFGETSSSIEAAKAIKNVHEALGISQRFESIENVCQLDSPLFLKNSLSTMTDDMANAGRFLLEVKRLPARIRCLNQFAKCKGLIEWIRTDFKDLKHLGTFLNLAGARSSASFAANRRACLNAACSAFSAFLFDLNSDADLSQFEKACASVFEKLAIDRSIAKKWTDSEKYLSEFRDAKGMLGSVEVASFLQLENINLYGRYLLGSRSGAEMSKELAGNVRLYVSSGPSVQSRKYVSRGKALSLDDLKDLQSRLILVSNHDDRQANAVVTFSRGLNSAMRLATAVAALCLAGHVKYLKWSKTFHCSRPQMVEEMCDAAREIENDLERWKEHIADVRSQWYYLNYFTTAQILVLARELGSVARNRLHTMSRDAFTLLECIKPDVVTKDVVVVINKVSATSDESDSRRQILPENRDSSLLSIRHLPSLSSTAEAEIPEGFAISSCKPLVFNRYNEDYITLQTLGKFLNLLAIAAPKLARRSISTSHLKPGYPNLFVVPESDVFPTALFLYMRDSDLSLPSSQEALLCSSTTTAEAISLFWRRALNDPAHNRRIFCLIAADRLAYDVSYAAVEEFEKLSVGSRDDYCLAIICAFSDIEYRSCPYMASAFERDKRQAPICPDPEEIQDYLRRQYSAKSLLRRAKRANFVDSEKSCVRVVYSTRAGVGKSHFVNRVAENSCLSQVTVPLYEFHANADAVVFLLRESCDDRRSSRLIHFDISPFVQRGLDDLLINLLLLGQLTDSRGQVWRKRPADLYVLECTYPDSQERMVKKLAGSRWRHRKAISFLYYLPSLRCCSPAEVIQSPERNASFNLQEIPGQDYQRVFQYLTRYRRSENLDNFKFEAVSSRQSYAQTLSVLLEFCSIKNPSWSIIRHFTRFLSIQLDDCEKNLFCDVQVCGNTLQGLKAFVLKLMIIMSTDFSTPFLNDSVQIDDLNRYRARRNWEQSSHPYLFFNEDRQTMTIMGLRVTQNGQLIDSSSGETLDEQIMTPDLSQSLTRQGFDLASDYNQWPKSSLIDALCNVMGLSFSSRGDPDLTYELTVDNVVKIMAIRMRFRCGIPVVVMGETGCGKTRLIQYMCLLEAKQTGVNNLIVMKVHGGTTGADISIKVRQAEERAMRNTRQSVNTVLFFDEANTTDAVGLIKEIMCDGRVNGRAIWGFGKRLHVIAACNPYRKHTESMIRKLESAGLGYRVRSSDTEDRLGTIPLRQLVYRVHPLPDSMKDLVWDFGQLNDKTEKKYIRRIVERHVEKLVEQRSQALIGVIAGVLAASQEFMRKEKDECSFVSLRDVERAMIVMLRIHELKSVLDPILKEQYEKGERSAGRFRRYSPLDSLTRALVLALAVGYQARLQDRTAFQETVVRFFKSPCRLQSAVHFRKEIDYCQNAFLDQLQLPPKIGRNHALKENVFMMVICIDLRIPLFLVGKPGSSKSLAKGVVADAMRGAHSQSPLFKCLKEVHMVSFQCSQLSAAEGIIDTFKECQAMQREQNPQRYVSCVVLDEVGLAEDSPKLPLKALHPLLDDGTTGAGVEEQGSCSVINRVAFVGISNWALDPAKMNRGILVQREVPDDKELIASAKGICSADQQTLLLMETHYINGLAKAYLEIYQSQEEEGREFFGLRDFYSLVKMIFSFCMSSGKDLSEKELIHVVQRNFGGLHLKKVDPVEVFCRYLFSQDVAVGACSTSDSVALVRANLASSKTEDGSDETRYLLLLTENQAALGIVRQKFFTQSNPCVIFGSNFPNDQEYSQVCRNINLVKVCMETGRTLILLNLENLYESLYDTLNQYYLYFGEDRYVDLGLGSHRVKCRVHSNFRLILIAERKTVYQTYPIPLINRMEKHFMAMSSVLTPQQQRIVDKLKKWVIAFSEVTIQGSSRGDDATESRQKSSFQIEDAFIGYHDDAVATVVLRVSREIDERECGVEVTSDERDVTWEEAVFEASRFAFLQLASPDAVARLSASSLRSEALMYWDVYFEKQCHSSLVDFLHRLIRKESSAGGMLIQVTTHSKIFSKDCVLNLQQTINCFTKRVALQNFDTEHQFSSTVNEFFSSSCAGNALLIVTGEPGSISDDLFACARYIVEDAREAASRRGEERRKHVLFVVHLPRTARGCFVGFIGGLWTEVHIDDLLPAEQTQYPSITSLVGKKISSLLGLLADSEDASEAAVVDAVFLFRSSIHGAISRLEDVDSCPRSRARDRLELFVHLIFDDELFLAALKQRVVALLVERDGKAVEDGGKEWVKREALSLTKIQAGGTFRRALWLRIVDIVTPILAKIICSIDLDSNFSLASVERPSWVKTLWIAIFSNQHLLPLNYDDLLTTDRLTVNQRFPVLTSGFGRRHFQARFPFSSLVRDEVDALIKQAKLKAGNEKFTSILDRVFAESAIGKHVADDCDDVEKARRYLHDYVRMNHSLELLEDDGRLKLVEDAVWSSFNEMVAVDFEKSDLEKGKPFVPSLPALHLAFERVRDQLKCFSEAVRINPAIIPSVCQFQGFEDTDRMTLDLVAFRLLLETLQPTNATLGKAWMDRVRANKRCIEAWFSLSACKAEAESFVSVQRAASKCLWTKICLVYLFVDHTRSSAEIGLKLWKCFLNSSPDFATSATLKRVCDFLDESLDFVRQQLIGPNSGECSVCGNYLIKDPVCLPCRHIFCLICIESWMAKSVTCPKCRQELPAKYRPVSTSSTRDSLQDLFDFKKNCCSFFMEIVAVYTFVDQARTSPCRNVVQLLMGLVVEQSAEGGRTRPFSPFAFDHYDPRPVFRSFLLQLLLKHSATETLKYIQEYFDRTEILYRRHKLHPEDNDLQVIFVQCIEDSRFLEARRLSDAEVACEDLTVAVRDLMADRRSLAYIRAVAYARHGLYFVAQFIGNLLTTSVPNVLRKEEESIELAKKICSGNCDLNVPIFLLKQIVRSQGADAIRALENCKPIAWIGEFICRYSTNESHSVSADYLVVIDGYKAVREAVAVALLSGSTASLESVKDLGRKGYVLFLLALYRESSAHHCSSTTCIDQKTITKLEKFCSGFPPWVKSAAVQILSNKLGDPCGSAQLKLTPGRSHQSRALMSVAFHFYCLVQAAHSDRLVKPCHLLFRQPGSFSQSYLPTMPDDPVLEMKRFLGEGGWYELCSLECPMGHAYRVENCGRPVEVRRCNTCGSQIGGQSHQLLRDNLRGAREREERGYIAGNDTFVSQERDLSLSSCSLIRLFLDSTLFWASCSNTSIHEVSMLLKPRVDADGLPKKFWSLLERDMRSFAQSIGHSVEDSSVLIHLVIDSLLTTDASNVGSLGEGTFRTKDERKAWEDAIDHDVITTKLREIPQKMTNWLGVVTSDEGFRKNRLMTWIYERDSPSTTTTSYLGLWRYRSRVTVSHLFQTVQQEFSGKPNRASPNILREFLRQESSLRLLIYLPAIVELQRLLLEKFHCRLARHEGQTFTVGRFLDRLSSRDEKRRFRRLINVFCKVWEQAGDEVASKGHLKIEPGERLRVTDERSILIAFLLPTEKGEGRCALALVKYLINQVHNEFVETYRRLAEVQCDAVKVPMDEVTTSTLIAYDFDKDLYPLILAHCDYSLEVGKGMDVTYNYHSLERQIVDRFVIGRPLVVFKEYQFTYCQDVYSIDVFTKIRERVPQFNLSTNVSLQIVSELRNLTDIYSVFSVIDVLVGFAVSVGADGERSICDYMHSTLQMSEDRDLVSPKANQLCRMKHILSLWRILMVEKNRQLVLKNQDPLESFPDKYKQKMHNDLMERFHASLRRVDVDYFLGELVDVALVLKRQEEEGTASLEEYGLKDALSDFINSEIDKRGLGNIPDDVKLLHLLVCWQCAVRGK